jgi:hypothetical protein
MNYVRFKKRILLTWTYNFLLIKTDIEDEGKVYVSVVCSNGIYITCIVGNNTQIESIMHALESKHIVANVEGLSLFEALTNIGIPQYVIPDMSVVSDFEMNTVLDESKAIPLEELSSLLNIEVKESIAVSKPLKVAVDSFCEVLANVYVPPPIKEMSINIELDFNLIIESNVADSKPLLVSMPFAFLHEASMNIDDSVLVSSEITDSIPLTISIINDTPIAILSSLSGQAAFSMNSLIKTSRSLKTNIVQNGLVTAIMRLMEGALLSDYDLLSLSDLDNLTLFEIDYIGE